MTWPKTEYDLSRNSYDHAFFISEGTQKVWVNAPPACRRRAKTRSAARAARHPAGASLRRGGRLRQSAPKMAANAA
eukprot:488367-Rhodomonas_salina.1